MCLVNNALEMMPHKSNWGLILGTILVGKTEENGENIDYGKMVSRSML